MTTSLSTDKTADRPAIRNHGILNLVGNTPLVPLTHTAGDMPHRVWAKLEFFNPSGSIKDRMALYVIEQAEREGLIQPGDLLVDNSSGNTAISVGMVGACKGYRTLFTVPDKTSREKIDLIRAFGAEVVVCPTDVAHDDPQSYYRMARTIATERGGFLIDQYHNPRNIDCHFATTGPEIWRQTDGRIDAVVAGIGTGGTLSGVGRYLKSRNPAVKVIAVDPEGSIFYDLIRSGRFGEPGRYQVEGLGSDVPCGALDCSVIDEVVRVDDEAAFAAARDLIRCEGLLAGGSSGSALAAVRAWGARQNGCLDIVTILPDSGMRYLSKFLSDAWMGEHGFEIRGDR